MKITIPEAFEIIYDDNPDWITVQQTIEGTGRWSIDMSGIFKHVPTEKYYRIKWQKPATEMQEVDTFYYDNMVTLVEVKPVEVMKVVWEPV